MGLGIKEMINNGNGNTIIYTALIAGAIANTLPTPFDGIYFRRVNELRIAYDNKEITAEKMETSIALEYYLWTSLWYVALFGGIYAFGGKYHNNARILLVLAGGGLVIGSVQKNIQRTKEIEALKKK
jgi:hypothetical protein